MVFQNPDNQFVRATVEDVRTAKDGYQTQQALYQLLQVLPEYFLQVSQSEIINSRQINLR